MTLTKDRIIQSLYRRLDIPRIESIQIMDSFLELMKRTLENGESMVISGFGKFCIKNKNDRRGRNPQTGNDLTLEARRVVTFKSSPVLIDKVNRKDSPPN
ncbi:MAG: integration host factor subunit alpha [Deltaproteobacteria bacterium]|nr:integration host factor subunit alpha [Deltaproteobacteria bacterium]